MVTETYYNVQLMTFYDSGYALLYIGSSSGYVQMIRIA